PYVISSSNLGSLNGAGVTVTGTNPPACPISPDLLTVTPAAPPVTAPPANGAPPASGAPSGNGAPTGPAAPADNGAPTVNTVPLTVLTDIGGNLVQPFTVGNPGQPCLSNRYDMSVTEVGTNRSYTTSFIVTA